MRSKNCLIFIIFFCLFTAHEGISQKIDTIYHTNGNVLTGDFRKLNYGVVTWKMAGMGTISFETPEISDIKSSKQFEVKLKNGTIYFGSFDTTNQERSVKLLLTNGSELLKIDDIVEVYPMKGSFWRRVNGSMSLGFNFSKGSSVVTLTSSGNINYRYRKSSFRFNWDNNNTFQDDTVSATNVNIGLGYERHLKNYWSFGALIGANQNSELGVKLRLILTTIGIRDIVYNRWNRFFIGAGLSGQRETPYDNPDNTYDLAGMVTTVWKVYKYTDPKLWVDADVSFLPYLTGDWRYRANFNLSPRVGVIGNTLQVGFTFYYTYDSRPPSSASSLYDWGINFELSYTLH